MTGFEILGQILGGVAVILGFVSFQMKSARKILMFEIATATIFSLHYLCLGAWTAVALNSLSVVQCTAYFLREKSGKKGKILPLVFTVLIVLSGILTWEGWHSLLIISGLAVYSVSMASSNPRFIRFAMLYKSPACLLYNLLVWSIGGVLYEAAVLTSSVIGLIKYKNKQES
jgi:hypothetical protein